MARRVYEVAHACDPSTEVEAPGLVPGTRLRPADVLTGALGNGLLALDIGIASPDAIAAGRDCASTMYRNKIEYYSAHNDVLLKQNITYQPMVFTCYGRPTPERQPFSAHSRPSYRGGVAAQTGSGGTGDLPPP